VVDDDTMGVVVEVDKLSEVIVSSERVNGSGLCFDVTTSFSSNSRSQLSPVSLSVRSLLS
jgi:hypothetical protein